VYVTQFLVNWPLRAVCFSQLSVCGVDLWLLGDTVTEVQWCRPQLVYGWVTSGEKFGAVNLRPLVSTDRLYSRHHVDAGVNQSISSVNCLLTYVVPMHSPLVTLITIGEGKLRVHACLSYALSYFLQWCNRNFYGVHSLIISVKGKTLLLNLHRTSLEFVIQLWHEKYSITTLSINKMSKLLKPKR